MEPASANASSLHRPFQMTNILLAINIIVFIAMQAHEGFSFDKIISGPSLDTLILFGAKQNGLIAEGHIERVFVPMFLHANLVHLAFNMYGLFQVGRFLELIIGPRLLLLVYVISGLTGNLCSFALIPALGPSFHVLPWGGSHALLSVGASSSLFGFLLCLYVLQKYEQKIAREMGVGAIETNLGFLILLNGILTFSIPNIDWASHLGGAIAGTIMGVGLCVWHYNEAKMRRARRFLAFGSRLPKRPFWQREWTYYGLLAGLNLIFVGLGMTTGPAERALGTGILAAAEKQEDARDLDYMGHFSEMLSRAPSDTDPDMLLVGAIKLHKNKEWRAAQALYSALFLMHKEGVGSASFLDATTGSLIMSGVQLAQKHLPPEDVPKDLETPKVVLSHELCSRPAVVFKSLGFFEVSGLLYECAYFMDPKDLSFASSAVEDYWRSRNGELLFGFLEAIQESQRAPHFLRPEERVRQHPERNQLPANTESLGEEI